MSRSYNKKQWNDAKIKFEKFVTKIEKNGNKFSDIKNALNNEINMCCQLFQSDVGIKITLHFSSKDARIISNQTLTLIDEIESAVNGMTKGLYSKFKILNMLNEIDNFAKGTPNESKH